MIEIRIHGRGGQGSVTMAELLSLVAENCDKYSQAFPHFGVERRGAPVIAFVRIDSKFIQTREQIYHPDYVIIQDATLVKEAEVQQGISEKTVVIINSTLDSQHWEKFFKPGVRVYSVPATDLALMIIGKPIVNTVLMGVFAKICPDLDLSGAKRAVKSYLGTMFSPDLLNKNLEAVVAGYNYLKN
jgi:pyruvate ferredoxin oxidoreductase gamma subunit